MREGLGERPSLRDFGLTAVGTSGIGVDVEGSMVGGIGRGLVMIVGSARVVKGCGVNVVRVDGVDVGKRRYRARLGRPTRRFIVSNTTIKA
jgi:hypothetical protein